MQDNDPKHTSNYAVDFMEEEGINCWKSPAESLDLNPIEILWHELKDYVRREIKPKTKDELIKGIERFWESYPALPTNVHGTTFTIRLL